MLRKSLSALLSGALSSLLLLAADAPADKAPRAPLGKYTAAERRHWSFQPRTTPAVPTLTAPADKAWAKSGSSGSNIDAFVLARLKKESLNHAPEADRATLIRRITFNLTGLPPKLPPSSPTKPPTPGIKSSTASSPPPTTANAGASTGSTSSASPKLKASNTTTSAPTPGATATTSSVPSITTSPGTASSTNNSPATKSPPRKTKPSSQPASTASAPSAAMPAIRPSPAAATKPSPK